MYFILIILKLLFFLIFLYYGIIFILYIIKKILTKKPEENASPPLYQKNPHLILVPAAVLLVLLGKYKYLLKYLAIPKIVLVILFWGTILALIIMIAIAGIIYYRMYGEVYNNPKMLGAQEIKIVLKRSILISTILFIYLMPTTLNNAAIALTLLYVYYIGQKINIRIFKQMDFIDEPGEQQDQTRANNKILMFFPIGVYIFFSTNHQFESCVTAAYLGILISYYNKPIPEPEKYPVIKAPVGSPERAELFWDATHAIEEPPIEVQMMGGLYIEELAEHKHEAFGEGGTESGSVYDYYSPEYVCYGGSEEDQMSEEILSEEMQIKLAELRNFGKYVERKRYIIHEYYFGGLMTDVPFYFGIKAFFEMLGDIFGILFRIFGGLCGLPAAIYCVLKNIKYIYFIHEPIFINHINFYIYCMYLLILYTGYVDLKRPYSGLAFYYRMHSYRLYDNIHPYAIYGPTVDGPRNGQYWFFIIFGYLPSRGLILLPELFAEEIRVTESGLRLNMGETDKAYHPDEVAEQPVFGNPLVGYRLRNASAAEKELFRKKILEQTKLKIEQRDEDEYLKYLTKPKWGTHYSI